MSKNKEEFVPREGKQVNIFAIRAPARLVALARYRNNWGLNLAQTYHRPDEGILRVVYIILEEILEVFELYACPQKIPGSVETALRDFLHKKNETRNSARMEINFQSVDTIRKELNELGFEFQDIATTSTWNWKKKLNNDGRNGGKVGVILC